MFTFSTIIAFVFGGCTAHPTIRHTVVRCSKVVIFSRPMCAIGRGFIVMGMAANPYVTPDVQRAYQEQKRYQAWRRDHPETDEQFARVNHDEA